MGGRGGSVGGAFHVGGGGGGDGGGGGRFRPQTRHLAAPRMPLPLIFKSEGAGGIEINISEGRVCSKQQSERRRSGGGGGGRSSDGGGADVSPTTVPVLPFFFADAENLLSQNASCKYAHNERWIVS